MYKCLLDVAATRGQAQFVALGYINVSALRRASQTPVDRDISRLFFFFACITLHSLHYVLILQSLHYLLGYGSYSTYVTVPFFPSHPFFFCLISYLPGIPRHKGPVQHFLGSKQISDVTQFLYLPISTRVVKRFFWILLLVSGGDISERFLCLCNPSLQQQVPGGLWNKPELQELRQGLRMFTVFNPCQSFPSLTILASLWFLIISLMLFWLTRLLFSGVLQFKSNFVPGENNSK